MRTLALHSLKGGVGKTVAAVNLAWEAAAAGERVLLWDLDPQGAASWYLRVDTGARLAAGKVLAGTAPLGRHVQHSAYDRLDAVPGDFSFRHLDARMRASAAPRKRLAQLIAPFSETYSLAILDCPAGIGTLAAAVMRAADCVLVPVVPTPLSLRALDEVRGLAQSEGRKSARIQPFFSLVDRRKRMHRDYLDNPPEAMAPHLGAWIGNSATIEQMGEHRAPVAAFAPRSSGAAQFRALWQALGV